MVREPVFRHSPTLPYDPQSERAYHRVTTVRSTTLILPRRPQRDPLYLGRLTPYYVGDSEVALPARLHVQRIPTVSFSGKRTRDLQGTLRGLSINIFQAPSGRILYAFSVDVDLPAESLVALMEDCYYESFEVGVNDQEPTSLYQCIKQAIDPIAGGKEWDKASDVHQLMFLCPDLGGLRQDGGGVELKDDFLRSLIYRVHGPLRSGYTSIKFPSELNRGTLAIAAVGPFVSVLSGHQDYVENTTLLSSVMVMGANTEVRRIQTSVLDSFTAVRERLGTLSRVQRQQLLGQISARLAQHEMDLSQYVESANDIGLWVPSLRVEDYHRSLVEATRLPERAFTIGNNLQRLTSITAARTQALVAEEQQLEEHRRRSWALIAGLLSTVAIPLTIVLAFFGVSSADVDENSSIFDLGRYVGVYIFAFGLIGIAALAVATFWYVGHPTRRRLPDLDAAIEARKSVG